MLSEKIRQKFEALFGKKPLLVRSPGRINMIGEHTDYNEGFVMPAAIDKEIICAISPNYNNKCTLLAYDLDDVFEFDITNFEKSKKGWPNYILGVVEQFQKRGLEIRGFDCVFGGNIPLGAGLSSSAALECAFAYSFNHMFDCGLSKLKIVELSQTAENEFVGVKCGIMDQFASMHGKQDKVFRLDCKTLEYEYYDMALDDYRLVLCDTGVKHSLASSEYNTRRQECETGVAILQQYHPEIKSLRDASLELLQQYRDEFDDNVYRRCKYVIGENNRVLECCEMLKEGDLEGFGKNMYKTHEGLSRDYEVSCEELDFLYEKAKNSDMVIGARMMGGGFGGCTLNIVKIEHLDEFIRHMTKAYKEEMGLELKTYIVKIEMEQGRFDY